MKNIQFWLFDSLRSCIGIGHLLAILAIPVSLSAQNSPPAPYTGTTINYKRCWSATAPGQTPASLLTGPLTDVKQTTEYYDPLGRPIQTVAKQSSVLGNDQVAVHTYDYTGIETIKYQPFVSVPTQTGDVSNDGKFKTDAFQQQVSFYNTLLQGQTGETLVGTGSLNWAYSQDNYEASPINRLLSSYSPGANWVGSQSSATPHLVQTQNLVNTTTDNVQMWNIAAAQSSIPASAGPYPAGRLYKFINIDELGHEAITYKDLYGQTILRKVQNTALADNGSGSAHAGWLCTYYVYDDYGNLRFIITPDVVKQIDGTWTISQSLADELCYRYEYDLLNRLVIQKTPGTPSGSQGEVWIVYDARNRIVMKEDGNMRTSSQWLCYLYDSDDRQVMSGTIIYTGTLSQLQASVTAQTGGNSSGTASGSAPPTIQGVLNLSAESMSGDWQASQTITMSSGFSSLSNGTFTAEIVTQTVSDPTHFLVLNNNPLPAGITITPLTANFYDNYDWLPSSGAALSSSLDQTYTNNGTYFNTSYNTSPAYAQSIVQSNQIHGLQTGQMTAVVGMSASALYGLTLYDDHGREIQSQTTNLTGGTDIATSQYNWSGLLLSTLQVHAKSGVNPQTHLVSTITKYDAMGRVQNISKTLSSTINGITTSTPSTIISAAQYDELGRLKQKTLGNNLETQLYEYNVRGWLLGMNRNYAKTASVNSNYFGFDLGYDKGIIADNSGSAIGTYANPVLNGNISGTVWKTRGDNQVRKYDFSYDIPNRMTAADFNQFSGGVFNKTAGLDFSVSNLSYDANGNIQAVNQNGWVLGGSQQIDQLSYHYVGGNSDRLLNVIDNSVYNSANPQSTLGDLHYAVAKTVTSADYSYDNNVNATSDANRNISSITYSYMNQPLSLTFTNNKGTIQYIYDAEGNKLRKITTENNVTITYSGTGYLTTVVTTTTYIDGFQYKTLSYTNSGLNSLAYTDKFLSTGQDEGRIRALYTNTTSPNTLTGFAFDYFLKDQLGDVRMVLTDEQQVDIYPAATLESSTIGTEQIYYNISNDAAHVVPVANLPWWKGASGSSYPNNNGITNPGDPNFAVTSTQVYKLNGQTGDRYGLGITLKVMAGDQISIFGKSAWHNSTGTPPGSYPITGMISSFLSVFAGTNPVYVGGHGLVTGQTLYNASATSGTLQTLMGNTPNQANPSVAPKAAINWILFNDQFVPVSMGTDLVSMNTDNIKSHAILNIPMIANGYLYVYCSNESSIDVYFDNLQVSNTRGPILEETHYYPFGLAMAGISDKAWSKLPNFSHFQGDEMQDQEFSDGTGLEEYDVEARLYDPQIGRWHVPDPERQFASPYVAMGNNWPSMRDPDGKWAFIDDLVAGAVGAIVNLGTELLTGQVHSIGQVFGYLASGFAGGVAFEYGGPIAASAVTSFGNALVGGASIDQAVGQGVMGMFTGMLAGPIGEAIGPELSSITADLGPTLSPIAAGLGTYALSGGIVGGTMSTLQGGDFAKGFGQGALSGLAGGAVSMGTGAVMDALRPNPFKDQPADEPTNESVPPSSNPQNLAITKYRGVNSPADRTDAANLQEIDVLKSAQAGAGKEIMMGKTKDWKWVGWKKMEYSVVQDGYRIIIHYWYNPFTGESAGYKFKNTPYQYSNSK